MIRKVINSKRGGRKNIVSKYPIPFITLNIFHSPKQPDIKSALFEFTLKRCHLEVVQLSV